MNTKILPTGIITDIIKRYNNASALYIHVRVMNATPPSRLRRPLLIGGPLLILCAGLAAWLTSGRYIDTDDAYTHAAQVNVSSNLTGRVIRVDVANNQRVRRNQVLIELDSRDQQIDVTHAEAALADARALVLAHRAVWRQRKAEAEAAQQTLNWRQTTLTRINLLSGKGIASQAQLEDARHAVDEARQQQLASQQALAVALADLDNRPDLPVDRHPVVQQAAARLAAAQLHLSWSVIRAPMDGYVTQVDNLQPGDTLRANTPLFPLISGHDVWIDANVKETDLPEIRPGQAASVSVDARPGQVYHGVVDSISPGTGASFALLPPENATGNWIKVVQRVTVRIRLTDLDPAHPLGNGLSSIVDIDTGKTRLAKWLK